MGEVLRENRAVAGAAIMEFTVCPLKKNVDHL